MTKASARPSISVGMPVYNGEPYVVTAIQSLRDQSFADFELIVCDNASTDRTPEICQDLAQMDGRIRYVRNETNIGAARNFNKVFHLASGPFFRWANADDIAAPRLHEVCLDLFEQRSDAVLVYGKTQLIDSNGERISDYADNLDLQQETPCERYIGLFQRLGMTNVIYGLMRTDAMRSTRLMGNGKTPAGDVQFMAELALRGKFVEIPELLFFRRLHPKASSWARSDRSAQQQFWNASTAKFTLPTWRAHIGFMRSIAAAPINSAQRRRLLSYAFRRMYWDKSLLLRELIPSSR